MSNVFTPFSLVPEENPDFNESDLKQAHEDYCRLQSAIQSCLDGTLPPDVLLDMLAENGVDVDQYVAEVAENVELYIPGAV